MNLPRDPVTVVAITAIVCVVAINAASVVLSNSGGETTGTEALIILALLVAEMVGGTAVAVWMNRRSRDLNR